MRVTIYEDPISREHPEGEATFLRWLSEADPSGYRSAWVIFDGDGEVKVFRVLDPETVRSVSAAMARGAKITDPCEFVD